MRNGTGAVRGALAAVLLAGCGAGDGYRAEVTGAVAATLEGPASFCADAARGFVLVMGGPGAASPGGFSLSLPAGTLPAAGDSFAVTGISEPPRSGAFSGGAVVLGGDTDETTALTVRGGVVRITEAGAERVRGEARLALDAETRDPARPFGAGETQAAALAATFAAEPGDACGPPPRGAGTGPASPPATSPLTPGTP